YLAPKQSYVTYLSAAAGGHHQWAACLYMALQQVRGGRDVHLDQSLSSNEVADRVGDGIMEIVDAWGNGLAFYRWPALNGEGDAMCPGGPNKRNRDAHDPSALLMDQSWWQSPGRAAFEQVCHLVSLAPPAPGNYPVTPVPPQQPYPIYSYYMVPVVASA